MLGEGNRGVMGRRVLKSRREVQTRVDAQLLETRIPGRFGNAFPEEREPVTGKLEAGGSGVRPKVKGFCGIQKRHLSFIYNHEEWW